ncbi:MAG: response regulator [Deltaproteobacteria bacterium]|nr:response regulator [Deltaproteobacteria bacterium]
MGAQTATTRARAFRPVVLLIDDDETFLHVSKEYWRENHRDKVELVTLNPHKEDPVAWIQQCYARKERLDAIFLDERIPGKSGFSILEDIRNIDQARYLPVAIMTAYPEPTNSAEALEKGALRYISKSNQSGGSRSFLDEALLSLPQLRDQAEDVMWIDLLHDISSQPVDSDVNTVVDMAAKFLAEHFGDSIIYASEYVGEKLRLLGSEDHLQGGQEISPDTAPYLTWLLDSPSLTVIRRERIEEEDVGTGPWRRLLGYRLVAVPLLLERNRIGTITLYRDSSRHPFRRKDESFLQHLALEISSFLGAGRILRQLRQRQTQLARFVQNIPNAENEKAASELLAGFLHQEVHGNDNARAKTTVRLLKPGTGKIERTATKGLLPIDPDTVTDIYQPNSVYAEVISKRTSQCYQNLKDMAPVYRYLEETRSRLTVPLLSSGLCLGAVNLEHFSSDYYSEEDEKFTEAVAGLTAQALVQLKAQRFIRGLLQLVNELLTPASSSTEELLSRAFNLLCDFTGSARLLYLVPGSENGSPWKVERVIGADGHPQGEREIERWRNHVVENWNHTFIRRTLDFPGYLYTEDRSEIESSESLSVRTEMMAVVHLQHSTGGVVTGIIALLFLLRSAINPFQREQLNTFGQFISALIKAKGNIKRLLDEKSLTDQEAALGRILGQFRHSMRGRLALLANALNEAQAEGTTGEWLQRAWRVLKQADGEIDHSRNFVKVPEHQDVDVRAVWEQVVEKLSALAREKGVILKKWTYSDVLIWRSDPDIVSLILENLVLNSIEQCRCGDAIELRVEVDADSLHLAVRDSGPGVRQSVRPRLFEPGITSKPDGTGFGLYFSRLRARDLHGDLRFDENHQPGAAFSLILPRQPEA